MTSRLAGLTAIVTGASSGIGEGVAARFVAEDATVFAASRRPVTLDGVTWVETDVADAASCDALIAAAVSATGRLDTIVNNAGVQVEKPIEDTTDDDYDLVMNVNVRGVFNCCRAAVRQMATQPSGGSIINIGSIAGNVADHQMASYNASKGALHALRSALEHVLLAVPTCFARLRAGGTRCDGQRPTVRPCRADRAPRRPLCSRTLRLL